jgi:2-(1,2-epoxy-1,2-dihydrophenyl)acetyl-CoA isomerase
MGLVHAVCPLADLPERTQSLAREMAEGPQGAMRFLKKAVYRAADQTLAEALDDIGVRTAITDHLADAREGGKAFVEKRKANFGQE